MSLFKKKKKNNTVGQNITEDNLIKAVRNSFRLEKENEKTKKKTIFVSQSKLDQ